MLEIIEKSIPSNVPLRALDVGSGSGLLSIFLIKKGLKKVYALDIDPYIIEEAKKNYKKNVAKKRAIRFLIKDLCFFKKRFPMILANVPINVHMLISCDVKRLLDKGGIFIAGGLLEGQLDSFLKLYVEFKVEEIKQKEGWFALNLKKSVEK